MSQKVTVLALPSFLESAATLEKDTKSKLLKTLLLLSANFRHPSLQCKKVQGARNVVYECRVDQDFRLIYDLFGDMLRCWFVGKHDLALKRAHAMTTTAEAIHVDDIDVTSSDIDPVRAFVELGKLPDGIVTFVFDDETIGP